jgi:broad specificity phosphatase PhoE
MHKGLVALFSNSAYNFVLTIKKNPTMLSRFLLFTLVSSVVIVHSLSSSSPASMSALSASGGTSSWTEADLLKEIQATQNNVNNDNQIAATPRLIHIKAERIDLESMDKLRANISDQDDDNDDDSVLVTKIVHFQRHGQGYHNLMGDILRDVGIKPDIFSKDPAVNPWIRPEIVDSPLTETGKKQCEQQRDIASKLAPEVMIVSPLLRAVQTAKLSFVDYVAPIDPTSSTTNNDNNIPWIAHEGCREELGWLTCNKRRPLSTIKIDFPQLQFLPDDVTDEDTYWDPSNFESEISKGNRIYDFLVNFIAQREERNIAVVCHSAWLSHMCNSVIDCGGDTKLTSWFDTSEIRSMKLTFTTTSPKNL